MFVSSHGHRGVSRYYVVDGAAWETSTRSFVRVLSMLPGYVFVPTDFLLY